MKVLGLAAVLGTAAAAPRPKAHGNMNGAPTGPATRRASSERLDRSIVNARALTSICSPRGAGEYATTSGGDVDTNFNSDYASKGYDYCAPRPPNESPAPEPNRWPKPLAAVRRPNRPRH